MVAGFSIRLRRRAVLLALSLSLVGAVGPDTVRAAQPGVPSINPTGRILEMVVPLQYRKFYLGDLAIRITPEQAVLAPMAELLRLVSPLLRPEVTQRLKQIGGGTGENYIDIARLKQDGFAFSFDPAAVQVVFEPTVAQKVEGNISVHTREQQVDSPNRVDPAGFAAFLNLRSGADYVGYSGSGDAGLKVPRLDLEGAVRWKDLVLEAEGTYEPDDAFFFGQGGAGFKRRGTRLIRDFEDEAIRATAGDIYTLGTSFQTTPDILGVSLERSVSTLQPGRNTRSTSRRTFRLERPSNVDVVVNGLSVRKLRLDPGDYNLSDLPVSAGSNDLVLLIEDDVGHTEKLEFSLFSDSTLLPIGLSEWTFAAGVLTDFEGGEPAYETERPFISGFYRRGLSESLTGEAHMQGDGETVMSGAGVLLGGSAGLFALEAAASMQQDSGWGAAFNGDYSLSNIEDFSGRRHRFRLSAKLRTPDFTLPDTNGAAYTDWLALSASYGTQLPLNVAASLSAGYGFGDFYGEDSYGADLSFSRPFGRALSMGVAAGYHVHEGEADDLSVSLRVQYRPDEHSDISVMQDTRDQRSTLSASREYGQGIGAWQTSVDITHEQRDGDFSGDGSGEDMSLNAAAHYTGNRANVSVSQDSRFLGLEGDVRDQRTSLRLETAIAVADGHVAVGRPVSNGFAIVSPHGGLDDNRISVGKGTSGYQAQTDFLGPALLPSVSSYTLNRVEYDVADLPPGYDLGDGVFDLQPRLKSGYALKVGSDYTVTALGTLQDREGAPLALVTGTAIEKGRAAKKVEIFTNRDGRFSAQGLAPGEWDIEMATEPGTRYLLRVPEQTVGMYRAEVLRPVGGAGG
jgi:outer membrane usher protein